jgi:hypothetical protein
MARKTRQELNEIVRREMPGYHVVEPAAEAAPADAAGLRVERAAPDAGTPDLEALRMKYLRRPDEPGQTIADQEPPAGVGAAPAEGDDDQIVAVVPDDREDPWDRAARPKSVVVNPDGKIIGAQG